METLEKKSLRITSITPSFFLIMLRYAIGGVVYATVSFFTGKFLERWKSKNKN